MSAPESAVGTDTRSSTSHGSTIDSDHHLDPSRPNSLISVLDRGTIPVAADRYALVVSCELTKEGLDYRFDMCGGTNTGPSGNLDRFVDSLNSAIRDENGLVSMACHHSALWFDKGPGLKTANRAGEEPVMQVSSEVATALQSVCDGLKEPKPAITTCSALPVTVQKLIRDKQQDNNMPSWVNARTFQPPLQKSRSANYLQSIEQVNDGRVMTCLPVRISLNGTPARVISDGCDDWQGELKRRREAPKGKGWPWKAQESRHKKVKAPTKTFTLDSVNQETAPSEIWEVDVLPPDTYKSRRQMGATLVISCEENKDGVFFKASISGGPSYQQNDDRINRLVDAYTTVFREHYTTFRNMTKESASSMRDPAIPVEERSFVASARMAELIRRLTTETKQRDANSEKFDQVTLRVLPSHRVDQDRPGLVNGGSKTCFRRCLDPNHSSSVDKDVGWITRDGSPNIVNQFDLLCIGDSIETQPSPDEATPPRKAPKKRRMILSQDSSNDGPDSAHSRDGSQDSSRATKRPRSRRPESTGSVRASSSRPQTTKVIDTGPVQVHTNMPGTGSTQTACPDLYTDTTPTGLSTTATQTYAFSDFNIPNILVTTHEDPKAPPGRHPYNRGRSIGSFSAAFEADDTNPRHLEHLALRGRPASRTPHPRYGDSTFRRSGSAFDFYATSVDGSVGRQTHMLTHFTPQISHTGPSHGYGNVIPVQNQNHESSTRSFISPLRDFGYPGGLNSSCYDSNTAIPSNDGAWGDGLEESLPREYLFEQGSAFSDQNPNTHDYFDPLMFEATNLDPVVEQSIGNPFQQTPPQQDITSMFTVDTSGLRDSRLQTHPGEPWDLPPFDAPTTEDILSPVFNWPNDTNR